MKHLPSLALLLALVGLLTLGCKTSKTGGKVSDDFQLTLTHVGCRGMCPAYTMAVNAKGEATYSGRRAVEMMGDYTKTLDAKTVKAMQSALTEAKFSDFNEVYGGGVADLPSIVIEATMNGQTKRVEDIREAPQALKELEAKLETLFGKEGWVKKG